MLICSTIATMLCPDLPGFTVARTPHLPSRPIGSSHHPGHVVLRPLAHAQSHPAAGDSTHLVGVGRLVQAINAVQEDELLTLGNEKT